MRDLIERFVYGSAVFGTMLLGMAASDLTATPPDTSPFEKLDRIPLATLEQMTDPNRAIGYPGLGWREPVVNVAFNGGDPEVYPLIEAAASEWTAHGGRLRLSFRRADGNYRTWKESDVNSAAAIRIGFFTDVSRNGYWSVVGNLANTVNASEATMNLGDLGTSLASYYDGADASGWERSYSHEVVLHEFGHALGLNHEHFHPQCQSDLNLKRAVAYLMGPPNGWSMKQAMFNMDAKTYFDAMRLKAKDQEIYLKPVIDQVSVMLYSFKDEIYRSGSKSVCRPLFTTGYATSLSHADREYYKAVYY